MPFHLSTAPGEFTALEPQCTRTKARHPRPLCNDPTEARPFGSLQAKQVELGKRRQIQPVIEIVGVAGGSCTQILKLLLHQHSVPNLESGRWFRAPSIGRRQTTWLWR